MKSKLIIFSLSFLLAVGFVGSTFATEPQLTDEQSATLSASCGAIRENLKNLQRIDARTRTFFGSIYETVASKYLKPLNLRLVNNDLSNPDLFALQTSLATARIDFSDDYIQYSKSLEDLIAIDCRLEPAKFYKKLLDTREKRATVSADVKILNSYLTSVVKYSEKLKEVLK